MLARASRAIKLRYPHVFFKKGKGGPCKTLRAWTAASYRGKNIKGVQTVKSCCSTHSIVPLKSEDYS